MTRAAVVFAAVALLAGPADAAERVVFCASDAPACARRETLGRAGPQSWAVVEDGELLAAAAAGRGVPTILYATRSAYAEAVAGLRAPERERAVLARRKVVTAGAWGQLPAFFPALVRADLLAVAGAGDARTRDIMFAAAGALGGGASRFASLRAGERWDLARRSLASLRAEVQTGTLATRLTDEDAVLAARGDDRRDASTVAPPFVVPVVRVYFLADVAPPTRHTPLFVDRPFTGWNGGAVVTLRPEERDQPPWRGHEARLMYDDKDAFLDDLENLTGAQLNRTLRARLAGPPRREHEELVASLAFEHAVEVRLLAAAARADGAATAWSRAAAMAADTFVAIAVAGDPRDADEAPHRLARLRADLALACAVARLPPGPTASARLLEDARMALAALRP